MKRLFSALCLICAISGHADRLFQIPLASILEKGTARFEFDRPFSNAKENRSWLQYGVNDRVEIAATHEDLAGREGRDSANINYGFVPPIGERFPGIGLGIRDLFNRTDEGRAYYVAFTYSVPLVNGAAFDRDFTFSFGVGGGGIKGLFAGFDLPLTNNFSLQAEHDSQRISAGVLWNPAKALGLRLFIQQERLQAGIVLSHKL